MLEQLTPEQAFELCTYHGIEPFGEVRDDLRMAHMLRVYIDGKRKRGSKRVTLGSLTLYPDLIEAAEESSAVNDLQSHLANMGAKRG